ncbi:class I adenylate-forming enzyme family protein [Rugamonas sp.]|uniref:class I adenylate-forming enzyme family protein n=1 Tax=Rugamonas sp. TaxID=1926287 RepID=UPI0025DF8981|nr:AMP-binding protein [Rugamonas sp.]
MFADVGGGASAGGAIDAATLLAALPARISAIPRQRAALTPHAPALHDGARLWSYAELSQAIDATAALLRELGVRGGDRLMVVGENCVEQVALIFAAAQLDAWIVNVNSRLSAPELDQIRQHCGARRVIYTSAASPDAAAHGERHGAHRATSPFGHWMTGALNDDCAPAPVTQDGAGQVAALIYTSGTTGQPKGVMLSHRSLLFVAAVSSTLRGLTPQDRAYGVLPISHSYGLTSVMLGTLYAGACLYLAPRFSPAALLAALREHRLTILQGVPAMYARLLETLGDTAAPLASQLRFIYAGGSPLTPRLKTRVQQLFGLPLHNGYGLSESGPTVSQTRLDAPRDDASVGFVIPGVEARLLGADGADIGVDQAGQLWIRGPNVMLGYWREPALTAAALRPDGWLDTGDIARRAADGALFIVGRSKELIIRSGFNVYPLEVETVLNAQPGVTQSAVVGRSVGDGDEEVVAFVELDPRHDVTVDQLARQLAAALAPYKRPAEIIVMTALPAAATGKILKGQLREWARRRPRPG